MLEEISNEQSDPDLTCVRMTKPQGDGRGDKSVDYAFRQSRLCACSSPFVATLVKPS